MGFHKPPTGMLDATINLKEAKARLSELVDRAESGETVAISRRGRVVAQITASPATRQPVDLAALRALTRRLPPATRDSGATMREVREGARY